MAQLVRAISRMLSKLLILAAWGDWFPVYQNVLHEFHTSGVLQVRHELIRAEIIPTVVDDFIPFFTMQVKWSKGTTAELGNTLKPKKLQDPPEIIINTNSTSYPGGFSCSSNSTYTIALTDPDAPSRDDPKWSEFCHWIVTGILLGSDSVGRCVFKSESSLKTIMSYRPPTPPAKTGKHRYVILILAPSNGTSMPLTPSKPSERRNWGTGQERRGVRDWATENGLFPVGANFVYSQNKKQ